MDVIRARAMISDHRNNFSFWTPVDRSRILSLLFGGGGLFNFSRGNYCLAS